MLLENITSKCFRAFSLTTCIIVLALFNTDVSAETLVIDVKKINQPVIIDGILEEIWYEADSVSEFIQYSPYPGEPLSEPTTAYILQDENYLYAAFRCRTIGRLPDCRSGTREIRSGDFIVLYLDTFNDKRTAYSFSVNCAGIQGDATVSENGLEENRDWDGIFESAVSVDTNTFIIEMAVPWSTLRYGKNGSTWGFNIKRQIPRNKEVGYVAPVEENERFTVSGFASLKNVQPAHRNIGLEVFPQTFYRREKYYDSRYYEFQPSVDVNWTATSSFQIQSTFNPDFSQIEADPFGFNLSKYDLYFDEKRHFFIEGKEYFEPSGSVLSRQLELFYSRKIGRKLSDGCEVPLNMGVRGTGKFNKIEYATLVCHTGKKEYTGFLGPAEEPRAFYNVSRLKYQLGKFTTFGILYAGKYADDFRNDVISIDGSSSTSKLELTYQLANSYCEGISDWAVNSFLFYHGAKHFFARMQARYIGNNFNVNEIGFVPWNGERSYLISLGPVFYPKSGMIKYSSLALWVSLQKEYRESNYSKNYSISWEAALRNGWGISAGYGTGTEYERGSSYNPKSVNIYIITDTSRRLWLRGSLYSWYGYNYYRGYFGRSETIRLYGSFRVSKKLSFWFNENTWVEHKPDNSTEEITYILRPSVFFSPKSGMGLTLYEETPITRSNGIKSIRVGISFKYNFMPRSWLIIALNDYEEPGPDGGYEQLESVFALKFKHLLSW